MNKVQRYILNQLVAADISVNALVGGSPYESISERAWRTRDTTTGKIAVRVIDTVFGWLGQPDHCANAAEGDEAQYEVWG